MKQKKIITYSIVGALCTLVFLGAYAFLFWYITSTYATIADLRGKSMFLQSQTKQGAVHPTEDVLTKSAVLENYFLPLDDPTPLLSLIETLARDAQVTSSVESITEQTPSLPTKDKGKTKSQPQQPSVLLLLSVSGSWAGVYHFISLLETIPYAYSLEKVVLQEGGEAGTDAWRGQITLRVDTRS